MSDGNWCSCQGQLLGWKMWTTFPLNFGVKSSASTIACRLDARQRGGDLRVRRGAVRHWRDVEGDRPQGVFRLWMTTDKERPFRHLNARNRTTHQAVACISKWAKCSHSKRCKYHYLRGAHFKVTASIQSCGLSSSGGNSLLLAECPYYAKINSAHAFFSRFFFG